MAFYLAGEITQVKESIPWVRCASGNVFFVGGFHYISLSTQRFVLMALSCPLSWHFMASSHHQLSPFWLCWSYSESYCCETQKSQIVGFAAGPVVRKELLTELPSAVFCLYCELQQGLFRTSVCVYFVCVFCVCILCVYFECSISSVQQQNLWII